MNHRRLTQTVLPLWSRKSHTLNFYFCFFPPIARILWGRNSISEIMSWAGSTVGLARFMSPPSMVTSSLGQEFHQHARLGPPSCARARGTATRSRIWLFVDEPPEKASSDTLFENKPRARINSSCFVHENRMLSPRYYKTIL